MRQIITLAAGMAVAIGSFAQKTENASGILYPNGVYYSTAVSFEISRPLRDLAAENPAPEVDLFDKQEIGRKPPVDMTPNPDALPKGEDQALQRSPGEKVLTPPSINFAGQSGSGLPNDPTGAAGLTAYVQAVNTYYRAYNKTTGAPLMNSLALSTLWPGSANDGDPIVLYDKYADRWLIEQFQQTGNKILIAISTTNDPTGTFYKYTFVPDPTQFPDYPKLAIWADGYYLCNNWTSAVKATVFNRTQMLAGNPSPGMIILNIPHAYHTGFYCPLPADADGTLPPSGTPENIFALEDDAWGAGYHDYLRVWKFTVDWTTPSNSTLVEDATGGSPISPTAFNTVWPSYANEIAQKGSTQKLDAIEGVLMYRAQYRRWVGHNTVMLSHAVNLNTAGQSGIRWYELWQDATSGHWSIHQQGTFAPNAENRWMSSIAMNGHGDVAMAYAVSGSAEYPSIRYTGRYGGDPLGQMTFTEQTAVAGTAAQPGINRYGDYSHTSIDPDDVTFWHTGEWMSSTGPRSQIFSWTITASTVAGIDEHSSGPAQISAVRLDNAILVKGQQLATNDQLVVDLFDIQGKLISGQKVNPSGNAFETSVDVSTLAKGMYLVRVGNESFQKVIKVEVN